VGKSTIAAHVAERLGIVRIVPTDSIREAMRAFFSETLMPSIHYSSYEAGKAVRIPVAPIWTPECWGSWSKWRW